MTVLDYFQSNKVRDGDVAGGGRPDTHQRVSAVDSELGWRDHWQYCGAHSFGRVMAGHTADRDRPCLDPAAMRPRRRLCRPLATAIVAIAHLFVGDIIHSDAAQDGKIPLPTVVVIGTERAIRDYPVGSAVPEALQAIATRRGRLERLDVRALINREFEQYDQAYVAHKTQRKQRLDALKRKLASSEQSGKLLACSRRMISEAEWLLNYTAEWPRLDQQLATAEQSLANEDQDFALQQTWDGSWGACFNAWFEKLDATVDFLGGLDMLGEARPAGLPYPFEILRRIDSSEVLISYLYTLQLSRIAKTGVYRREEMNASEGALSQLLLKGKLRALLQANGASFIDDEYVDAYRRFLDDTQDPILGYWGPWIMSEDKIIRTSDLSQTYHIVAYRKGAVEHWPQIIETTLAIKDLPYPFGWRHNGQYSNHHNYDVVRIFRLGWSHMTPAQMGRARTEIRAMLNWALSDSIHPDGRFRDDFGFADSGEAYYYGVSFLAEIGYWNKERRFWDDNLTNEADAEDLCRKIRSHLLRLPANSIPARRALARLNQSCSIDGPQ